MKISLDKSYRTRSGRRVVLYTITSEDKNYPVVGHILLGDDPVIGKWTADGKFSMFDQAGTSYQNFGGELNLIIDENG